MPFTLSDPMAGEDLAAREIAHGEPSTFGENFRASIDSAMVNERFVGEQTSLENAFDDFNAKVFRTAGKRLPNPVRGEMPEGVPVFGVGDETGSLAVSRDMAIQAWQEESRKLGFEPPSVADMENRARAARRGAEQRRDAVAERSSGFLADAGGFLGSMAGIMTDPPVLASMAFGAGESQTFLRAVGREALVAGGTEATVQPQVQKARVEAGLPGGFVQGAENVGFATLGAAGLTSLFRGAAAGYRGMRNLARERLASGPLTPADADAARYVERHADLHQANPLSETAEGMAEHVERTSQAQQRLIDLEESTPRLRDRPATPVRSDLVPDSPNLREAVSDSPIASRGVLVGERLRAAALESEAGAETFARAQETAGEIAGSLDDATLDLVRGSKPIPPRDDPSLVQFIIAHGGVNDADQALSSIGVTPRRRPGLISRTGISASRMSELVAEAGYFAPAGAGEGSRIVDQRELATAILDELDGKKLYARHGVEAGNLEARTIYEQSLAIHEDMNRALNDLGINPKALTNDEIRDAVESIRAAQGTGRAVQADHTADAISRAERAAADLDQIADMEERLAIATENDLREIWRERMDETVWLEVDGQLRPVRAADVFAALDDDNAIAREFAACVNGVPF